MIQFNLLPDVKQEYIKAARQKRTVIVISFLVALSTLFVFAMLFLSVHVFQKLHVKNLNADIKKHSDTLKNTPDLEKVLTIQNQLNSLPDLHAKKPVASRLFGYLGQITPAQVNIGDIEVDFDKSTIDISGTTDALSTVNKFVDTMKFTTYSKVSTDVQAQATDQTTTTKPFSKVVLSSFAVTDKQATYKITLSFDPVIFNNKDEIALTVPKIISTRSDTEKPTELFKALPEVKQQ